MSHSPIYQELAIKAKEAQLAALRQLVKFIEYQAELSAPDYSPQKRLKGYIAALEQVAEYGHVGVFHFLWPKTQALLTQTSTADQQTKAESCLLTKLATLAVSGHQLPILRCLSQQPRFDVNEVVNEKTVLMTAVEANHPKVLSFLLTVQAVNVLQENTRGETALYLAQKRNKESRSTRLLQACLSNSNQPLLSALRTELESCSLSRLKLLLSDLLQTANQQKATLSSDLIVFNFYKAVEQKKTIYGHVAIRKFLDFACVHCPQGKALIDHRINNKRKLRSVSEQRQFRVIPV